MSKTATLARFDARLSFDQKNYFERAANLGGYRNLTDFILTTVQQKANEIITTNEKILSSHKDAALFFDALSNPPQPNESLKNAVADFKNFST